MVFTVFIYVGCSLQIISFVAWKLQKTKLFVFRSFQATENSTRRLQPTVVLKKNLKSQISHLNFYFDVKIYIYKIINKLLLIYAINLLKI